jgi:hypothetical protein
MKRVSAILCLVMLVVCVLTLAPTPVCAGGYCGAQPPKPPPPPSCKDLAAQCRCDAKGQNCNWTWVCVPR